MKRLFTSLMVVSALLTSMTAGSLAVFSESESILGNSIATGVVDIDLRALSSGEIEKPISADHLVPGDWTDWARAEVYNTAGSEEVRVYFYVENRSGECGKTNLELYTGYAGGDEMAFELYSGYLSGVAGPANRVEVTGPVWTTLEPNITAVVHQRAGLDESAGNGYMGTTCTWDEVFVAETVANI